jgi:hypothetical protein
MMANLRGLLASLGLNEAPVKGINFFSGEGSSHGLWTTYPLDVRDRHCTLEERTDRMVELGMTPGVAAKIAAAQGPEMGRASLLLYRSARHPAMAITGQGLERAAARPGLCLLATEDHYVGSDEIRRRAAERAGARTQVPNGLGHWWMVQEPARGAAALTRFWDSLNSTAPGRARR